MTEHSSVTSQVGCVYQFDPKRVKPFLDQPRKRFRGIAKLAASIRLVGQITPIVVTPCDEEGYDAELVDGERRLRACLLAKVPVRVIYEEGSDDRFARSVAANFCRQSHDCLEILEAVLKLQNDGLSQVEIASLCGKTPTWVCQHASLAKLAPFVRETLKAAIEGSKRDARHHGRGVLTFSIAVLLASLPQEKQVSAMTRILAEKMSMTQAKAMLRKTAQSEGIKGRIRPPGERFRTVFAAVEACCLTLDKHLDMPGPKIQEMLNTATRSERQALAKMLERLCENLLAFGDVLVK